MFFYTGIGSRETPESVMNHMTKLAIVLAQHGYCLRSGGAIGADWAFQRGAVQARGKKIIYKPELKFGVMPNDQDDFVVDGELLSICKGIAEGIHPKWSKCNDYARRLHARNVCQVLGHTFKDGKIFPVRSDFVLYYADEDAAGKVSGGTATAVHLARKHGIPTINMKNESWEEDLARVMFFIKTQRD